jgi:hypothetical protein
VWPEIRPGFEQQQKDTAAPVPGYLAASSK